MGVNDPLLTVTGSADDQIDIEADQHALYADRRLPMTRLAFLLTGSRAVAEEVVHDAFEQVVKRWVEIAHHRAYLRTAVVNGARSWGRRQRELPREPLEPHPAIDSDAIAVRDALADLRHAERESLVLRYYGGLTDSQIAELTQQPIGTVKSNIYRGLGRMREALQ